MQYFARSEQLTGGGAEEVVFNFDGHGGRLARLVIHERARGRAMATSRSVITNTPCAAPAVLLIRPGRSAQSPRSRFRRGQSGAECTQKRDAAKGLSGMWSHCHRTAVVQGIRAGCLRPRHGESRRYGHL